MRKQLAEQLNVDSRQVQIWFQNRRQRERVRQGAAAREAEAAVRDGDCSPVRESKGAAPLNAPIPAEFTASGARAQIISAAARRYPARDSRGTAPTPLPFSLRALVCRRSPGPLLCAQASDLAGGGESSSASTSSEVGPAPSRRPWARRRCPPP